MTHTVHPFAHRLGILRDWRSRWFAKRGTYQEFLRSDVLLREFLEKRLKGFYVSSIEMERNEKSLKILVATSRPGLIIGRGGEGSEKLKADIMKFVKKHSLAVPGDVKIEISEVRSPESNAAIVAHMVAEGLEKRMPFRRILKQTADKVMANRDVLGVRIALAGRLGGADMARHEEIKKGRIPLQTFRADIDFAKARALIPQDELGIKVWIYKGEVFEDMPTK
ncbi:30S ribosomal protein S3 [Candidatus Wolfebacteria bacterium]|nr:30S ribosomal protein S3 [Candidatus Wolfebacteria bacterium]